mmetsp:Transcript_10999/g.12701  ORF Transcript_10999/g.12701 Transcript_10999/m.12701 type:complete len:168 (-) Transcript_10999:697-1200(-)
MTKLEKLKVVSLESGDGKTYPRDGDVLEVDYTGILAESKKEFDSNIGKAPFKFSLGKGQVIQGWEQGMSELSLGEKAELHIPSDLAYGELGYGDAIPANSDLIFTVQLRGIERERNHLKPVPKELTEEEKQAVADSFIPDLYKTSAKSKGSKSKSKSKKKNKSKKKR